jgi:hypothetical protein
VGVQEMLASRQVVRSVTPLVPIGVVGGSGGR